jgi:hypothetical protein
MRKSDKYGSVPQEARRETGIPTQTPSSPFTVRLKVATQRSKNSQPPLHRCVVECVSLSYYSPGSRAFSGQSMASGFPR